MNNTWIILANETEAQIFNVKKGEVEFKSKLTHPDSRLLDQDIVSDRPGVYAITGSTHTGNYMPRSDPHENEQEVFAMQIARFLEKARTQHEYHDLIICAEPHFYGKIKKSLTSQVEDAIKRHILRDYMKMSENEMKETVKKISKENFPYDGD